MAARSRPSAKQRRAQTIKARAAIRARAETVTALLSLPYMDADQSAIVGNISASSIRRGCNDGSLRHVRVNGGKLIRITPDDLREWLRSGNGLRQAS